MGCCISKRVILPDSLFTEGNLSKNQEEASSTSNSVPDEKSICGGKCITVICPRSYGRNIVSHSPPRSLTHCPRPPVSRTTSPRPRAIARPAPSAPPAPSHPSIYPTLPPPPTSFIPSTIRKDKSEARKRTRSGRKRGGPRSSGSRSGPRLITRSTDYNNNNHKSNKTNNLKQRRNSKRHNRRSHKSESRHVL